jgi:hypothetical protein
MPISLQHLPVGPDVSAGHRFDAHSSHRIPTTLLSIEVGKPSDGGGGADDIIDNGPGDPVADEFG